MRKGNTKQAILDKLPESWEHVLRKEKKLTAFQSLVYYGEIPKSMRKASKCKANCRAINRLYINLSIESIALDAWRNGYIPVDIKIWREINKKIQEYEDACR